MLWTAPWCISSFHLNLNDDVYNKIYKLDGHDWDSRWKYRWVVFCIKHYWLIWNVLIIIICSWELVRLLLIHSQSKAKVFYPKVRLCCIHLYCCRYSIPRKCYKCQFSWDKIFHPLRYRALRWRHNFLCISIVHVLQI